VSSFAPEHLFSTDQIRQSGYGTRREANYLPDEEEVSPIARSDTDRTIAEIPEDY
jgi:hypothetical protein